MTKRILFIGTEQPLWEEFRAYSAEPGSSWVAGFAQTQPEACALLGQHEFDAVVADVQLADTSGLEFLDEVLVTQPRAHRIILSDLANPRSTVKCLGRGHHHLLTPCDVATLLNALAQATSVQPWLPTQAVQDLLSQMRRFPSPPAIYFKILLEVQSPDASVEKIGEVIAQDPAISARIMQLANSAVFGLQLQVIHPAEAVAYIGLETTKTLVLAAHTFSSFDHLQLAGFSVESLWRHSVLTGQLARRIAAVENTNLEIAEEAFAAGLLHDLGKLLFAANLPKPFRQALALAHEQGRSGCEAEAQVLGASHAELGACLLSIWGLPAPIVEAVALHHYPVQSAVRKFSPLTAVHAADALTHEAQAEPPAWPAPSLDLDYLRSLGLDQQVDLWRSECLAPEAQGAF